MGMGQIRVRKARNLGHPAGSKYLRIPDSGQAAYNRKMEISFAPELEARLNRIASQTGKVPAEVVHELVANYLDHDEWFRQEVGKGLASLDQGKTVSHEEVRRQMDRILGSR
jgi:predicted transcriptional regulator